MNVINFVILYDFEDYFAFYFAYYIITRAILCLYYKASYIDKWFLGILPFSSLYFQGQLTSLPLWVKIPYVICGALSFMFPFPFWIAWRALTYVKDYMLGDTLFESPAKFMAIPFYRYYRYLMETIALSGGGDD